MKSNPVINLILIHFITALLLSLALLLIYGVLQNKLKKNREKSTPFECGFDPIERARLPFSLRFFLLAILFLIFDIEIALLIPLILTIKHNLYQISLINGVLFLIILLLGLFHE
jgi:NADH-ubiquinone oxidoreductase chain 3